MCGVPMQMGVILKYDHVHFATVCSVVLAPTEASRIIMSSPVSSSSGALPLDSLALQAHAVVRSVLAPPAMPDWADWLAEIGFLPGESVQVIARGAPGGDPLVVRIGDSTFALRKAEAACVQVQPAADWKVVR